MKLLIVILTLILASSFVVSDSEAVTFRGKSYATIDIQIEGDTWGNGEPALVSLTDADGNRDSSKVETLSVESAYDEVIEEIPDIDPNQLVWLKRGAVSIISFGNPLMLVDATNISVNGYTGTTGVDATIGGNQASVDSKEISGILLVTTPNTSTEISNGDMIEITLPYTGSELKNFISTEPYIFSFFNYDVRSLMSKLDSGAINNISITISDSSKSVNLITTNDLQGYFQISSSQITKIKSLTDGTLKLNIVFDNISSNTIFTNETELALVADFFSFGMNGFQIVNNAIYRLELKEIGVDSDTFEGTLQYSLADQFTIADSATYSNLKPIGNSIIFFASGDLSDAKSPRLNYLDMGIGGTSDQVSDQQEIDLSSGSFKRSMIDSSSNPSRWKIILDEKSLNTDPNVVEKFTPVTDPNDPAYNMIGKPSLPEFTFHDFPAPDALGALVAVYFNNKMGNVIWNNDLDADGQPDCSLLDGIPSNLASMGFELVETGANTGIFEGIFEAPKQYCQGESVEFSGGRSVMLFYFDFHGGYRPQIEHTSWSERGYLPTMSPLSDIEVTADNSLGARVDYQIPTVTDIEDDYHASLLSEGSSYGAPSVGCTAPAPNEIFPIGTTEITCTATDKDNNRTKEKFSIEVFPTSGSPEAVEGQPMVCATGTYLVDGACKPRPDQVDSSTITLTSAEPKILNTNNERVSVAQIGETLFVGVEIENLGDNTEDFVASYRYLASSIGNWSDWTWVSSSINAGKYSDVAIPWNPTIADNYEFDIQIWDNVSEKNIITSEKLIVTVKSASTTDSPTTASIESKPKLSFVDETKDPQSYIDRYNNEPEYKTWFDENFPDYSIEEAVGLPESAKEKVPGWIKNNAKWWADGQIGDSDFTSGIQHLMKEKIINIPNLPEQASEVAKEKVPDWIKNNAGWWAEGLISEGDFLNGIKYLVEKGIIKV